MAKPVRSADEANDNFISDKGTPSDHDEGSRSHKSSHVKLWRIVLVVALVVLICAIVVLALISLSYWNGQKDYDDIAEEAFSAPAVPESAEDAGDEPAAEFLDLSAFSVDWDELRAINPDVVGWIYIPDTVVDYPIAHIDGDDSYYLYHNFSGSTSGQFGAQYGCIMLSGVNAADFSDEVNVVYGHNMSNGSMFSLFAQFYNSETLNAHRTIYLLTPKASYRLGAFAVDRVLGSDTSIVIPNFDTPEELEAYVRQRYDDSVVPCGVEESELSSIDRVFAFSTCDGADDSYRYITFCRVEDYFPTEETAS